MIPAQIKKQIKKADKISAWMEATQIAGFTTNEADKFFGRPEAGVIDGLQIVLRPPLETRRDYVARHNALLKEIG